MFMSIARADTAKARYCIDGGVGLWKRKTVNRNMNLQRNDCDIFVLPEPEVQIPVEKLKPINR
jgi:hypothetical protein